MKAMKVLVSLLSFCHVVALFPYNAFATSEEDFVMYETHIEGVESWIPDLNMFPYQLGSTRISCGLCRCLWFGNNPWTGAPEIYWTYLEDSYYVTVPYSCKEVVGHRQCLFTPGQPYSPNGIPVPGIVTCD